MKRPLLPAFAGMSCILALAACNFGGSKSAPAAASAPASSAPATPQRGQLTAAAVPVASYDSAQLASALGADPMGQLLLTLNYSPGCTVNVYRIQYNTVGAKSEAIVDTAGLMVPSGSGAACTGPRPIVEYAHGTTADKNYDITLFSGSDPSSEGLILAALFASGGYIVVAPDYAGYAGSSLSYHPYLVGQQQADDMMDAITAARSALPVATAPAVSDSGKLYITGYSQGGYVAMATARAMQQAGQAVTASAPMSGPYALEAFGDALFLGQVNGSATVNYTLVVNGYQNAYGNLFSQPSDMFAAPYSNDVMGLLPGTTSLSQIYAQGLLPQNALFSSTPPAPQYASITPATAPATLAPAFALGFGTSFLVTNDYRLNYLQDQAANPDGGFPTVTTGVPAAAPANTLRQDLRTNDLRNWSPAAPVLLCGGNRDPEVFFFNTQLMQQYWTTNPPPAAVTVLDVDSAVTANDPYAAEKQGFAAAASAEEASAVAGGATDGGLDALLENYHTPLVPPFCLWAVKSFFDSH